MASRIARFLRSLVPPTSIQPSASSASPAHRYLATAAAAAAASDAAAKGDDAPAAAEDKDDKIFLKSPNSASTRDKSSVTMPMSFMTGSIVGKRFYKEVTTRMADDGNGWTVMLDYRTLKTPCKRPLKLRSLALAKAIAAEWEYQEKDGIRPFTMPLMKLTCTALERVPLTRATIIGNILSKFHQDLVFCRSPGDNDVTIRILKKQEENLDPILDWLQSKFGFKPAVYSSLFGGKQDEGLTKAISDVLKGTNDFELAAIDALAAHAHSIVIPLAIFFGRIGIEEAIKLIRLEEDQQIDRWGLVEGGHDVDIADLKKRQVCRIQGWFERMGWRRNMIVISCFPLLLMLLLQLVACSSPADHFRRYQRLRGDGFGSSIHRYPSFKFAEGQKVEDKTLDEEKRMVFTGPNPLHN